MWTFIKESLLRFESQGAIVPSSSFLAKRMTRLVNDNRRQICIVELGAGTGSFTRQIIANMSQSSRLFVFEINPVFAKYLRKSIQDKRVFIIEADAADLCNQLDKFNIKCVDYVVSGLPLGNFSKKVQNSILSEIRDVLSDTGTYIQFQYFLLSWFRIRSMFETKISGYEMRNIPPAFIYECKKKYSRPRSIFER